MSVDSRKKLTAFYDSGKVVVTSEFVNSMFGGLHGTSEGDIIASVDPNDPRIVGHLHDGTHADGHASKIDLTDHVKNKLGHVNLGDGAVRRGNIQCYPEALKHNAIPEFEVDPDTGEKCYYLNLDLPVGGGDSTDPAGNDTEIQFNDKGVFGAQAGYVFKKEDVEGLRNGKMGINIQSMEQNEPLALSVYGDGQLYSDESLAHRNNIKIDEDFKLIYGGFIEDSRDNNEVLEFRASHQVEEQRVKYITYMSENNTFASDHLDFWKNELKEKFEDLQAENETAYLPNTIIDVSPHDPPDTNGMHPRYNDGPNYILSDFIVGASPEVFVANPGEEFLDSLERFLNYWGEYYDEVVSFFGIDEDNRQISSIQELYSIPPAFTISGPEERARYFLNEYESAYGLLHRALKISRDIESRLSFIDENEAAYGTAYKRIESHLPYPEPMPNRWYKYSYTISEASGDPEIYISNSMDFYPWGANGNWAPNLFEPATGLWTGGVEYGVCEPLAEDNFIPNIDVPLSASVGSHFVYFRSRRNFKNISALEPMFSIEVKPNNSSDSLIISEHKLEELVDGDLHVFGLITGGGDKGISIRQNDVGDPRVGINLDRDEMPEAELHIRGNEGRCIPDDDLNFSQTPIIIEDIPPCSWVNDFGIEFDRPNIRGTLVINDFGRVYVNEKIKCEEAGSGIAPLAGDPGEIIFVGSGGILESNRAIAIDKFRLINPVVSMVDSHNDDWPSDPNGNPISFSSFEFSSAEDDGTGTEVTSLLAKVTASRDTLSLIGGGSLSSGSPSSGFVPPNGMINIGTTILGKHSVGLRVDSHGRATVGDVESLDLEMPSGGLALTDVGIIAGMRYEITANPDSFDFTQFGATDSLIGTSFISNSNFAPGSASLSATAMVSRFFPRHAGRTLHVVGVDSGTPPVRIEDITLGDSQANWGHSLMVNPDGDIYKNVGGAQFMEVTAGEDLDAGVPVSFGGFDSANGRITVKVDGNGSLSGSSTFSSDNDTFVGITAGSALANDLILIQNYGLITSANIMLSAIPTAWFSDTTIPAGTPLKTMTLSQWTGLGSPWAGFSETKWLTLDVSSGSGHPIDEASKRNRVGFLAEDWLITSADLGGGVNPTNTGIQLENAKVYIRPGW